MYDDAEILCFEERELFRAWLQKNYDKSPGIWIVFKKGDKRFTANDALEEAICFGWIDGKLKSIDEKRYRKYFAKRKSTTKWSDKNIELFKILQAKGKLSEAGNKAFKQPEKNNIPIDRKEQNQRHIEILSEILKSDSEIFKLYFETTPSRRKQLAGFYCDAKTAETKKKRIEKIVESLKTNYKGMLY